MDYTEKKFILLACEYLTRATHKYYSSDKDYCINVAIDILNKLVDGNVEEEREEEECTSNTLI